MKVAKEVAVETMCSAIKDNRHTAESAQSTADANTELINTTKTELESRVSEVEAEIPTKVSELENDAGYTTESEVTTEIDTAKTELTELIEQIVEHLTWTEG